MISSSSCQNSILSPHTHIVCIHRNTVLMIAFLRLCLCCFPVRKNAWNEGVDNTCYISLVERRRVASCTSPSTPVCLSLANQRPRVFYICRVKLARPQSPAPTSLLPINPALLRFAAQPTHFHQARDNVNLGFVCVCVVSVALTMVSLLRPPLTAHL